MHGAVWQNVHVAGADGVLLAVTPYMPDAAYHIFENVIVAVLALDIIVGIGMGYSDTLDADRHTDTAEEVRNLFGGNVPVFYIVERIEQFVFGILPHANPRKN